MNSLNSVLIEGNMVRDPLLRTTAKGTSVGNFTIASNRFFKHDSNFEKEVGFFEVEVWGKLAEACTSKGRKGRGVRVVGRLKQDRWTGSDGKNHSKVAIVAEHVEYRADFRQKDDSQDTGDLADQAMANTVIAPEHLEILGELEDFSGGQEEQELEELQTAVF